MSELKPVSKVHHGFMRATGKRKRVGGKPKQDKRRKEGGGSRPEKIWNSWNLFQEKYGMAKPEGENKEQVVEENKEQDAFAAFQKLTPEQKEILKRDAEELNKTGFEEMEPSHEKFNPTAFGKLIETMDAASADAYDMGGSCAFVLYHKEMGRYSSSASGEFESQAALVRLTDLGEAIEHPNGTPPDKWSSRLESSAKGTRKHYHKLVRKHFKNTMGTDRLPWKALNEGSKKISHWPLVRYPTHFHLLNKPECKEILKVKKLKLMNPESDSDSENEGPEMTPHGTFETYAKYVLATIEIPDEDKGGVDPRALKLHEFLKRETLAMLRERGFRDLPSEQTKEKTSDLTPFALKDEDQKGGERPEASLFAPPPPPPPPQPPQIPQPQIEPASQIVTAQLVSSQIVPPPQIDDSEAQKTAELLGDVKPVTTEAAETVAQSVTSD